MKKIFLISKPMFSIPLLSLIAFMLMLGACKKDRSAADDAISAEDHANVNSAMNSTEDDATNIAGNIPALSGKVDATFAVCNATIDSSRKSQGILIVTFNGVACNSNISRTGSITITLVDYADNVRWRDQGAVLKVDFNDVRVTNTVTGSNVTLNGTHYITNVTGGLAWKVVNGLATQPVVHKHTATDVSITFNDGTIRKWSVNRKRTFGTTGSTVYISISADTTLNGHANVDTWGINRRGDDFVSTITNPIVSNQACGWYKPVAGQFNHFVDNRSVQIIYGVDTDGNPISTGCAWGYKVIYTVSTANRTKLIQYWF